MAPVLKNAGQKWGRHATVQRQAQADREACDRLLKSIFDRGLGQRQIARVTGIPLSTVQRALQRVIYPYRQDRRIENAPTWKKRRAKLESLAIDQLQPARDPTAGTQGRIAPRKSRVTGQVSALKYPHEFGFER
jgi:hypothetical protein